MINCEHELFSVWFYYFFSRFNFNEPHSISIPNFSTIAKFYYFPRDDCARNMLEEKSKMGQVYGGRELPIEKIGFLRNKFFIFYIFSF